MVTYLFDGSMDGLLSAIFDFYERKPGLVKLMPQYLYQPSLLGQEWNVHNDPQKAGRVWHGLGRKLDKMWINRFYAAYLSEKATGFQQLFDFACYVFDQRQPVFNNYSHPNILAVAQLNQQVHREKHRMEAFIRFRQLADGIYYAGIEPDFNVLPLIAGHFKKRYADQPWIIYDLKRRYGLYYDLSAVSEICIDFIHNNGHHGQDLPSTALVENEALYATLWKDYFNSTNILSRRNSKLHIRHVPKRYWKFLTEKL